MKSLTKAIKQEMDIDWDALDGKTVRIVSSGDISFDTAYTLTYAGKGPKRLVSSWIGSNGSRLLYKALGDGWYGLDESIELIMDEGVPLLSNTDSETIDPYSIPTGSVVILESKRGVRHLAYRNPYWFVFFAKEVGEQFSAVSGSLFEDDFCSPSSPYKIVSYITPEDLIQTLTSEPTDEGAEVTSNTVHITSPDSFEAMGQRISGLIAHSFGGDIKENLPTEAFSEISKKNFAPVLRNFAKENLPTEAFSEATKVLKNTVKPSLNLDPEVIGKKLNDSLIEAFSKTDWGKK